MSFHILTPELQDYLFAISFTWCLGSSNFASHIYARYFINTQISSLFIQCVVKGLICFAMLVLIPLTHLFSTSTILVVISLFLGILGGWLVVKIEFILNRYVWLRDKKMKINTAPENVYSFSRKPSHAVMSMTSSCLRKHRSYLKQLHEQYVAHEAKQTAYSLMTILLIALFEEVIFRGYLVHLCDAFPGIFSNIALLLTVLIFGLSHASYGLCQILAKTCLGGFCMAVVLVCHSLLPAIVIHGYLNWVAFQCQQR